MASSPKRRNGTSPTTIVLILLLLGAVAGAARLVTPAPPGPPVEAKPPPPNQQSEMKAQHDAEQVRAAEQHQAQTLKLQQKLQRTQAIEEVKAPPMADPDQPSVTNDYFLTHKPGAAGQKQVEEEQKAKRARYEQYKKILKAAEDKVSAASPKGPAQIVPEPGPGVPPAAPAPTSN